MSSLSIYETESVGREDSILILIGTCASQKGQKNEECVSFLRR
jgi:hypothetical protein